MLNAILFKAIDWLKRNPIAPLLMLVAVAVRLHASGGLGGLASNVLGKDPGVYYAAAAALVDGQMPYRDYTLVHPPGVAVFLAPFAWLADSIGDPRAFGLARLSFIALGAINTLLIYLVASRIGRVAAISAAALYCVLPGPIWAERTTYLEAPMLTATLLGLLVYGRGSAVRSRWVVLAGVVFGIAISFKLWAAIPFLVILVAFAVRRSIGAALRYLAGAAAAAIVVMLPFFVAAPGQMLQRTLGDQVGRDSVDRWFKRIEYMFSINAVQTGSLSVARQIVLVVVLVAIALVCWFLERRSRLWVILFGIQVVVAMAVPVFFGAYRAYYAVPLALMVGTLGQVIWTPLRRWWEAENRLPALAGAAVAAVIFAGGCGFLLVKRALDPGVRVNVPEVSAMVAQGPCVTAWNPAWLMISNSLTRTLHNDCEFAVDLGGTKFRMTEAEYEQARLQYLDSGDYVFVLKGEQLGELADRPVLTKYGQTRLLGPSPAGTP